MSQSPLGSLIESCVSVAIGFAVSVGLTVIVLPAHGYDVSAPDAISITIIYTVASTIRSYLVRRAFESRRG